MKKNVLLYEGKAKRIYSTEKNNCYRVEYKDDATAYRFRYDLDGVEVAYEDVLRRLIIELSQ